MEATTTSPPLPFLSELKSKAEGLRPALDKKYVPTAPVPWDVNRKDRSTRFADDYRHELDDGTTLIHIKQEDPEQDIGSCVWTAAIMLAKYIEHHHGAKGLVDRECIELGSGTGLVGLVAASLGGSVTLTDLDHVVPRLRQNIALNTQPIEGDNEWHGTAAGGRVRACELTWGKEGALEAFPGPYRLVVACEVIYEKQHTAILLETLRGLVSAETELLFAFDTRGRVGIKPFLEAAEAEFVLNEVPDEDLHPQFRFAKIKLLRGGLRPRTHTGGGGGLQMMSEYDAASHAPARAIVSLAAIRHNVRLLQLAAQDLGGARLMCVLKADAYGHGSVEIAKCMLDSGVEAFAVATVPEALSGSYSYPYPYPVLNVTSV